MSCTAVLASEVLRSALAVLLGAKGSQTPSPDLSNQLCIADAGLKSGMQLLAFGSDTMFTE
jgi:hypothetical protein